MRFITIVSTLILSLDSIAFGASEQWKGQGQTSFGDGEHMTEFSCPAVVFNFSKSESDFILTKSFGICFDSSDNSLQIPDEQYQFQLIENRLFLAETQVGFVNENVLLVNLSTNASSTSFSWKIEDGVLDYSFKSLTTPSGALVKRSATLIKEL